jgi:uncharacterized protein (DUF885 family)
VTKPNSGIDRRQALAMTLSAAAVSATPGLANAAVKALSATPARRFSGLLAQFAEELLRLSPLTATSLGLDSGPRLALKSKWSDGSPAGEAKWAAQVRSMLTRLGTVNRAALSPVDQVRHDTVKHAATMGAEGLKWKFGGAASGFNGGTSPYPVTQQDGAITQIPEFLDSQHQIKNAADAEAYVARVAGFARLLEDETAKILDQGAMGIVPPAFVVANALGQLKDYRKTPVGEQKIVNSIVDRTNSAGIAGNWGARVSSLVETMVYPALEKQIAALSLASAHGSDVAGVHKLPDGEAYYQWALKLGTTTDTPASEVHAIGLEQNKAIQSRMDAILKAQGMTQGTVGERVQALNRDPRQLFPDTDAGRADLIAYCNERVAATRKLLPNVSHLGLKAPLIVKRVPTDIQDGASLGYMNFAALDGSRPAIYYINLKSTTLWPKYQIPTLTVHEGVPGHTWQGAYLAEHHAEIPLITSLMGFNAFIEGWALYSEQLMDEAGLYANDPFGQIGYLQAQQFRACRLVVDTGIHAMRWTRDQAIDFLVNETGKGRNAMTSEVDRYSVSPGQACGYKMGHNEINKQRDRAKAALGSKFDLAAFNDTVVKTGGVPLTVLGTAVDQFVAGARL